MLELKMKNGDTSRIRKSAIQAVNTQAGFDHLLSNEFVAANIVLSSGSIIGVWDTKSVVKAAIDAMAAF